jgi:transcriptional regulator with XRE-family HTH domain
MAKAEEERLRAIGERIRELRGPKPMRVIAAEVGVTERAYSDWERGKAKISWDHLETLAGVLKTTPDYLLHGETPDLFADATQLDRIEAMLATLVNAVSTMDGELLELSAAHALTRADVERLVRDVERRPGQTDDSDRREEDG